MLDSGIQFTCVVLSSDSVSGLPFKDAIQEPEAQPESIKMASGATEISLRADSNAIDKPTPASFNEVADYISNGFETLKGLNFSNFKQIYPVFLPYCRRNYGTNTANSVKHSGVNKSHSSHRGIA